jgi:hypothetical protein
MLEIQLDRLRHFDNLKLEEQYLENHHLMVFLNIVDWNALNRKTRKQKKLLK